MTEVRCTVKSCEFWEEGDHCGADKIWVKNNLSGAEGDDLFLRPDFEFGEELVGESDISGVMAEEPEAQSSHQTCCETMRLREERDGPLLGGPRRGGSR